MGAVTIGSRANDRARIAPAWTAWRSASQAFQRNRRAARSATSRGWAGRPSRWAAVTDIGDDLEVNGRWTWSGGRPRESDRPRREGVSDARGRASGGRPG